MSSGYCPAFSGHCTVDRSGHYASGGLHCAGDGFGFSVFVFLLLFVFVQFAEFAGVAFGAGGAFVFVADVFFRG